MIEATLMYVTPDIEPHKVEESIATLQELLNPEQRQIDWLVQEDWHRRTILFELSKATFITLVQELEPLVGGENS